ncbi:hypothetical protein [Kitasatospora sp. NPDC057198]|uniref:hypothetical protein n=1 Tax=Kitasatospora sp. NPDC057198 TaxID=3346046 RepID=UPI00363EBAE0
MFENIHGMPAKKAEQLERLVEECRPVLAGPGMSAVQELLTARGLGWVDSIVVTRALAEPDRLSLHQALDLVRTARS